MEDAIEARRKERGFKTVRSFIEATGLTGPGLIRVRRGEKRSYQDRLTMPIAVALRWPEDWYQRLLEGQDYRTFPERIWAEDRTRQELTQRIRELEELDGRTYGGGRFTPAAADDDPEAGS